MSDLIRCERREATVLLSLNRPDALNSLDGSLLGALGAAVDSLATDGDVRAVVVTGVGRAFAAGADIEAMRAMNALEGEAFSRLGHETFARLEALSVPTIAAVNGYALGGGCELALACDWIVASKRARFGQPEVNLGLIPGFGGTSRLLRRVGGARARELVMTGETVKADEALRIGLANRVFEPDDLLPRALEIAATIATRGPLAVAAAKRVMRDGQDADVRVAHALEQHAFGSLFSSADREEGLAAFLEKRDPKFTGK